MQTRDHEALPRNGEVRRAVLTTLARSVLAAAALVAVYFLLPLDGDAGSRSLIVLALAAVGLTALVTAQLRAVMVSPRPALRAVEALAVSAPSLVLLFAAAYHVMSLQDPGSFNESLSRVDALYFSVTTLATVGYGDIVARSDPARLVVSAQMMIDLVALGLGLKVVLSAVQIARQRTLHERPGDAGAR